MITSYEVGSVFRIVDEASPALERIAKLAAEVDEQIAAAKKSLQEFGRTTFTGLTRRANATADAIARIGAVSEETRGVFAQSMESVNAGLMNATRTARELAAAMGEIGVASRAMARASAVGVPGVGGRGGGRHGLHVSGLSAGVPGGRAHIRGGNVAMLGAGALAYGVYEEAELEDATARMMLTIPGAAEDREQLASRRAAIRKMLQDTASRTGAPIGDLEEATLTGIRQFAGMPFDKRMEVMPGLLQAAAAEAKLKGKGTSVEQAMESMTGLAHMFQVYDPAGIAKMASAFAYISAVDPEKLPSIERAASYAIPRTRMLQIDPMQQLLLIGAMQRAGVRNSKAGTWISAMAQRAMPGTSLMSRVAFEKHEKELAMLGLVDSKHQPTWFTDGKPDLIKMLTIAGAHVPGIPLAKRGAVASAVFGQQGAGGFGLLSDPKVLEQIKILNAEMPGFKTGLPIFEELDKDSPVQKAREAWGDLRNVLMDIGSVALPPLVESLKSFDTILKTIRDHFPAQGNFGGAPLKGTLGEALGRGMAAGVIPGMAAGFMFGGIGVPFGAALGAFGGGLIAGGNYLFGGGLPTSPGFAPAAVGGAGLPTATGTAAHMGSKHMVVTATIKADPSMDQDGLAHKVASYLAGMLSKATEHNTGQGDGVLSSPFTSGADIP